MSTLAGASPVVPVASLRSVMTGSASDQQSRQISDSLMTGARWGAAIGGGVLGLGLGSFAAVTMGLGGAVVSGGKGGIGGAIAGFVGLGLMGGALGAASGAVLGAAVGGIRYGLGAVQ